MEIVEEMMVVFANHRLSYWSSYRGGKHNVACACGWDAEPEEEAWQANKAAGRHLAEQVEHLVIAEVTDALEAHEEAVRLLSGGSYEYCVEYDPYVNQVHPLIPRPVIRTKWRNQWSASAAHQQAMEDYGNAKLIRRRKPGPEEDVTINA